MATVMVEPLVDIRTVAGWLGCSEDTVRRRCEQGLPHRRFGNRYKFLASEVAEWIARSKVVVHASAETKAPAEAERPIAAPARATGFDAEVKATRRRKA